jgi:Protein of unknown function (DUF2933)
MGQHIRMHAVLAAALLLLLALRFAGVAIPTAVVYVVVLACPLMMVWMMLGRHGHEREDDGRADHPASRDHTPT